jgi:caffeoyl-CoA O-methyltransferase
VTIEVLARAVRARRVFELGSGFGYSAYWFSRAVGPNAELHLTDSDPTNERRAMRYLARAGLDRPG